MLFLQAVSSRKCVITLWYKMHSFADIIPFNDFYISTMELHKISLRGATLSFLTVHFASLWKCPLVEYLNSTTNHCSGITVLGRDITTLSPETPVYMCRCVSLDSQTTFYLLASSRNKNWNHYRHEFHSLFVITICGVLRAISAVWTWTFVR